jgi:hypothetical protein
MLCPKTWVLKRTRTPEIESPPNSTKNLGSNRNPSIGGQTRSLGDQDQAQRCTKQLSIIPTNKSEPKHHRIEGISRTRKTDENSSKKTWKSNELQTGNRRNHEKPIKQKPRKDRLSEKDLGPLRQWQRLNTTEIKCSKIADSSRWGKRARHHQQKSRTKIQAKKTSQMHECKVPLNKCSSPKFSFLDANSP